jgi:vancomycin resistance protein YoaR
MGDSVLQAPPQGDGTTGGRRATRRAAAVRRSRRSHLIAVAVTAAVALVIGALLAWFGVVQGQHKGRIAPGVTVSGVDLGGMTQNEAVAALDSHLERHGLLSATLKTPQGVLDVSLPTIGIEYDVPATAAAALRVGRRRILGWDVYTGGGRRLDPVLHVRPRAYLQGLVVVRDQIDKPAADASLRLDGRRIYVVPAVEGVSIDDIRLERALLAALARGERFTGVVPTRLVAPDVTTAEAQDRSAAAAAFVRQPLLLRLHGRRIKLQPAVLATILAVNEGSNADEYPVTFDNQRAKDLLKRMLADEQRQAVEAKVVVRDGDIYITESKEGVAVDLARLVDDMTVAAAPGGSGSVSVGTRPVYPELSTKELRALGLSALGSEFTTYYSPRNKSRADNIALAAKLVDGTIVRPGKTFSLNATLGPRTQNRGFDSAPVIVDGVLRQGVGGGICQYATTLFNAVFFAGLPVVERHPHTFAIGHYPLGRDAAVSWGTADLKFRNTSGRPLMISSFTRKGALTVVIVGTTGRTVSYTTGARRSFRSPTTSKARPRVIMDGDLSKGIVKWENGARGYTIAVVRTVRENGKLLFRDRFVSTYAPRDWVKRIGTRT